MLDKKEIEKRIQELETQINNDINTLNNLNNHIEQIKQKILQEQGAVIELKRILPQLEKEGEK